MCEALQDSGRLELLDEAWNKDPELEFLSWRISNGHTPGLCLPTISGVNDEITFMGDLIPGSSWLHIPIAMAYDRYPEMINDEKLEFYKELAKKDKRQWLFYTHDKNCAYSQVEKDAKGKYQATHKHDDENYLLM